MHAHMAEATLNAFAESMAAGLRIFQIRLAEDFQHHDGRSMAANNSVGYHFRTVAGRNLLSHHAFGLALDLNPQQNPYIREDLHQPKGAVYDVAAMGTITPDIAAIWKKHGFHWGGDWQTCKDYMHFSWAASDVLSGGRLTPEAPSK